MTDRNDHEAKAQFQAHLPELGRLVSAAGTIEFHLAGLLAELISTEEDVSVVILKHLQTFERRRQIFQQLLPVRLRSGHAAEELRDALGGWISDAADIMKRRNTYLHSMWLGAVEQSHAVALSNGRDHIEVPLAELRNLVAEAEDVSELGALLWEQFAYLTGRFDALIVASRQMGMEWDPEQ